MKQQSSRLGKIGTELTSQWTRRARKEAAPWNDVSNTIHSTSPAVSPTSSSACRLLSVQVIKLTVMSFHCWTKRNEKCEDFRLILTLTFDWNSSLLFCCCRPPTMLVIGKNSSSIGGRVCYDGRHTYISMILFLVWFSSNSNDWKFSIFRSF